MHIDWWTLALQAINVLVLVWLLSRFLFTPVMAAISARQAAADKLLADAEVAKAAVLAQQAALKVQNDSFSLEAEQRRADLHASIETESSRLLAEAKSAADTSTKQARAAGQAERARMVLELEKKASVLAGEMASTLLQRLPGARTTDALFAALVEQLRALPDEARAKLAQDGPLAIVTPMVIDGETQARYLSTLATALPGLDTLTYRVDADLIAGFELQGSHVHVRNSWRADLDAMLAKLKDDDHARLR